jgi:hypothetical protein
MTGMGRHRESETAGRAELLRDADRPDAWMLLVDGVPQSHVDLDDPGYLDFEYVRRLGHVIDEAAPPGQPLRVLHLGAGALTLARYVAVTRPGSSQLAVEVDAALVDLIRLRLPPRNPRLRIRIGEARRAVRGAGVVTANVADGPPLAHAKVQVATARTVFPHACLIADAGVLRGRRFGNLVLAASPEPLPADALTRRAAGDPMPGRVLSGRDLDRFTAGAKPVTDATAAPSPAAPPEAFAF